MPTYIFYNKETEEVWEDFMSINQCEIFLADNPHIIRRPVAPKIVAGVGDRTKNKDSGWNETLAKIAEHHPNSALSQQMGVENSVKQTKVKQAVEKWRKSRAQDPDA